MGAWLSFLSKGLKEGAGERREVYVFGAVPGSFSFDGWVGIPVVWDETGTFDLSLIQPEREVCISLLINIQITAGHYIFEVKWYRDRDNALLYHGRSEADAFGGAVAWSASWLGWFAQEISENGAYHLVWTVTGPDSYNRTIAFNVTGIAIAPGTEVPLKAGGNLVTYSGKAQLASAAFASISSYLTGTIYYFNNVTGLWQGITAASSMVPYGCYWIEVTQDCSWTFGPDETAPTSVQLYAQDARGYNIVSYCGPSQSIEQALSSIWDYFLGGLYWNNTTKQWVSLSSGYTMVPNTPYAIAVTQDCVWTFAAVVPHFGTEIIEIDAPSSAFEGDTVNVDVSVKNIGNVNENIGVIGVADSISLTWQFEYLSVLPGETVVFRGWFTMPAQNVRVTVDSSYWDGSTWVPDDTGYIDITYAELPPPTFKDFSMTEYIRV